MVGLHTCGDLAASTLRMFVAKPELSAVCGVGCCYHLLSEEFNPDGQGNPTHTHTEKFSLSSIKKIEFQAVQGQVMLSSSRSHMTATLFSVDGVTDCRRLKFCKF